MPEENKISIDHIYFEQYKMLVTSYESLIGKRTSINNIFVIIYSSIFGFYNFINNTDVSSVKSSFSIYSLAIFISVTWVAIILKFIKTEEVKYKMVQDVEANMPLKLFSSQERGNYLFNSKIPSTIVFELLLPIGLLILFSLDFYFNIRQAG